MVILAFACQGIQRQRPLIGAAVLVMVLHASALFALSVVLRRASPREPELEMVEVIPVDEETVKRVAAELERAEAVPVGPAVIVTEPGPAPKVARYIANHHSSPARETVARGPRNDRVEPTPPSPPPRAQEQAQGEGGSSVSSPSPSLPEGEDGPRPPVLTASEATPPPSPSEAPGELAGDAAHPVPVVQEQMQPIAVPALDLPVADQTAVRARQSAMAEFVRQVQQAVARHWFPSDIYTRVDPGGKMPGIERLTVVRVRVRADGALERADIEGKSGVRELDDEAKEAFGRAQPFTRPPAAALDNTGSVTFSFTLSLDLAVARWKSAVKRLLRDQWRPSRAIRFHTDRDRVTVVRVLLTFEGVVAHFTADTSSGSSFLDNSALSAFKTGMRLPNPPAALGEVAGLVPVRIAFLHRIRGENDIQVMTDSAH